MENSRLDLPKWKLRGWILSHSIIVPDKPVDRVRAAVLVEMGQVERDAWYKSASVGNTAGQKGDSQLVLPFRLRCISSVRVNEASTE